MKSALFPDILRSLLSARGITITHWARRVGISQGYASNLCTGRRNPCLDHIDAWARDLNVTNPERKQMWAAAILSHLPEVAWPHMQELITAGTAPGQPDSACEKTIDAHPSHQ